MTLAIAFAVLQIEPPGHLARVTELKAKDELREDNSAKTVHQSDGAIADKPDHLREEAAARHEERKGPDR